MLHLAFRISRLELLALLGGTGLAVCALIVARLPLAPGSGLIAVLLLSTLQRLSLILQISRSAVLRVWLDNNGAALLQQRGGMVAGCLNRVIYRSGWLTVLEFRCRDEKGPGPASVSWNRYGFFSVSRYRRAGRRLRVFILPDSVALEQRRQLAVVLRHFPCLPERQ